MSSISRLANGLTVITRPMTGLETASIALFGYSSGDPLAYDGDSIANSMADTAAAAMGAMMALPVAGWMVGLSVVAVEIGITLWIGDGFIQTLARIVAG